MFYPGYRENMRDFVANNENYTRHLHKMSPWPASTIDEMKKRDVMTLGSLPEPLGAEESFLVSNLEFAESEHEIKKYFTFNSTGNIMVSSTVAEESELNEATRTLFQKAAVFFGAVTAAANKKGKTLYDYDAINEIVAGSGFFIQTHEEDRTFKYDTTSVKLNTAIIAAVLGGVAAGAGALVVAQKIIEQMGSQIEISVSSGQATKKIGHLLFVVENLMGMPFLSISLFYIEAQEGSKAAKSNCGSVVRKDIEFRYHQDTWMFIDPEYISRFTPDFAENPEYEALIERLAGAITS